MLMTLLGISVCIVGSIILYYFFSQKPLPFLPRPKVANTGFVPTKIDESSATALAKKNALKLQLPIEKEAFKISFDYRSNRFITEISPPYEPSLQGFRDWLKQENLTAIEGEFIIQAGSK